MLVLQHAYLVSLLANLKEIAHSTNCMWSEHQRFFVWRYLFSELNTFFLNEKKKKLQMSQAKQKHAVEKISELSSPVLHDSAHRSRLKRINASAGAVYVPRFFFGVLLVNLTLSSPNPISLLTGRGNKGEGLVACHNNLPAHEPGVNWPRLHSITNPRV